MPKVVWVALPLLAALVLLAVQWLRRRTASRHELNVWSSLLLLVYVLTTAGLGIFWVANQQLPVFDWHYLFGYATLLLVALHLVFNFGVVWRHLTRFRDDAVPASSSAAGATPARRAAFGALGVALAAGVAFVLGLRHGRSELRIEAPAAGSAGSADRSGSRARAAGDASAAPGEVAAALALVERFHAFSSHSRAGVLLRAPSVEWGDAPPPFKQFPGAARIALPPRTTLPRPNFDLDSLGATLWHTAGVTATRAYVKLRASPSSGALFATELYVAATGVAGLASGLWHYDAQLHALERLGDATPHAQSAAAMLGASDEGSWPDAAAVVIATAVFRRTGHKYRDRTYRYVWADLGHALENLRVAAQASGTAAQFIVSFDESRVAAVLNVDEHEEGVLALVALTAAQQPGVGLPAAQQLDVTSRAAQSPNRAADARPPAARLGPASVAPAAAEAPLGVTGAVHAATSLRASVPPPPDAPQPRPSVDTARDDSIALPNVAPALRNALSVISARRSIRRTEGVPLALDALAGVLAAMAGSGAPRTFSGAVRVNVVAHAVAGVPPGAYRYDAHRHALLPRRAAEPRVTETRQRAASRAAALDQDVVGDAAVVFVLSIDRAAFSADPAGPARGYRHAFLEAGMIGERVYLEAGARGLGACAVGAFYDGEAAALIGADPAREWVVHFATLGVLSS